MRPARPLPARLFTTAEAAAFLRIHPDELTRLARTRQIGSCMVGKRWRYTDEDLSRFIRFRKEARP